MLHGNINFLTRLIINGNVKKTSRALNLYSHGSNTSIYEYNTVSGKQTRTAKISYKFLGEKILEHKLEM